jgi:hypothetical protein
VVIDRGVGIRGPSGQETVTVNNTGTLIYTAMAYGQGGLTTQKKDTVFVLGTVSEPPSLTFSIAQDTVTVGESIDLSWQSNGWQVVIDQGVGVRGPNGSDNVIVSTLGMRVYTATAYNQDNLTTEKKDTVYVVDAVINGPSLDFNVVEDSVMFGEPVHLEWQSDGYQVVIDNGVGQRGPFGTEEVLFVNPGKKVFVATAYGEQNTLTFTKDSVYVKEAPLPALPVLLLTASRNVAVDSMAVVSWYSQNADYVLVDIDDYGRVSGLEGNIEIVFTSPGVRYVTATAFNAAGHVVAEDTIEVVQTQLPDVDDIIASANCGVRADKGAAYRVVRNAAQVEIQRAGRYRIIAEAWFNSGDDQLNESFYLEVRGSGGVVLPDDPNAANRKVVADEPGEPHTSSRDAGIFNLTKGTNEIDLYHYSEISSIDPRFLNGPIQGAESVMVLGFTLQYLDD